MGGDSNNNDALHSLAEEEVPVARFHLQRNNLAPCDHGFGQSLGFDDHAIFLRAPRKSIFILDRVHGHIYKSAGRLYAKKRGYSMCIGADYILSLS